MIDLKELSEDEKFMDLALKLAVKGIGSVNPNPLVGAVLVKNGKIIGQGYHEKYGEPHAEVNAVADAVRNGNSVEGATIYVTLEPCSHYGKTPPCADLLVEKKIKRCIVATLDPNEKVAGRGVRILQDAGIEVIIGVLEKEAKEINQIFLKYITTKIPYIFLKCGITLDGKIATSSGNSRWITNSLARAKVQEYRNRFTGIMVGKNTVINDNPRLRTGIENGRDPYRIVFDSKLETPVEYNIIQDNSDGKTIIITKECNRKNEKFILFQEKFGVKFITLPGDKFKMSDVIVKIGELGIDSILLEGGSQIISQFFKEKLIDAGEIFIAPKILGDSTSIPFISGFDCENISDGIELKNVRYTVYGDNIGLEFNLKSEEL